MTPHAAQTNLLDTVSYETQYSTWSSI